METRIESLGREGIYERKNIAGVIVKKAILGDRECGVEWGR